MELLNRQQHLGICCFIWQLITTSGILAGEPPKIRKDYRAIVRANVMDRVQISCPFYQQSGDSAGLFFRWTKDNESISLTRFETKGAHLILDDVELEDAGLYACTATNGFGSQSAGIKLIVIDPLAESTTTPNSAGFESSSNDLLIQGLGFTEETLRQPSRVRITAGSSLDIQCGVTGYPYPDLIWLKNGAEYKRSPENNQPDETSWRKASLLTLPFRRAASGSSANYTCLALGLKGRIETTFDIQVLDSTVPDMSEVHPSNVTEFRGGRAKFHCWVRSTSRPEVQWLKRLPGVVGGGPVVRNDLNLYSNTSLVVGQDHYQKLESDELMWKEDGSYLKTLQLDPLSEKDAGLYLCLAINRYGYSIEKTYLNVKPNYETSRESKSVPISIMVALPSMLLLSIACGFVCWMKKREKLRRQAELAALATGWSHAFVAQEQQQHQQQQQQQQAMEATIETTSGRGSSSQQQHHSRQTLTSSAGCHRLNEEADPGLHVMGSPARNKRVEVDTSRQSSSLVQHQPPHPQSGGDDLQQQQQQQPNYYFQQPRHHQLEQQRNTSSSLMI